MPTAQIRQTKKYSLYQGHGATAKLYSVIRRKIGTLENMGYTDTWMNEFQKEELLKMPDEDFDAYCNKIDFQ